MDRLRATSPSNRVLTGRLANSARSSIIGARKGNFRGRRDPVEFKLIYVMAMRNQAPRMFRSLVKSGKIDQFLQAKSEEAHELLRQVLGQRPKDAHGEVGEADRRECEEVVRATLVEFPTEGKDQTPEPPDDLPRSPNPGPSRAGTSPSGPMTSGRTAAGH